MSLPFYLSKPILNCSSTEGGYPSPPSLFEQVTTQPPVSPYLLASESSVGATGSGSTPHHMQAGILQTAIPWNDPFSATTNVYLDSRYESVSTDMPSGTDYSNMFANPPCDSSHTDTLNTGDYAHPFPSPHTYSLPLESTQTSSNTSSIQPWSFPSRSLSQDSSTTAYAWTFNDKSPAPPTLAQMGVSYPIVSNMPPPAGIDHWVEDGPSYSQFPVPKFSDNMEVNAQKIGQTAKENGGTNHLLHHSKGPDTGIYAAPQDPGAIILEQYRTVADPGVAPGELEDNAIAPSKPKESENRGNQANSGGESEDENLRWMINGLDENSSQWEPKKNMSERETPKDFTQLHQATLPMTNLSTSLRDIKGKIDFSQGVSSGEFSPHAPMANQLKASPHPLPSDSGYHSGLGTDTESVCSMDSITQSLGLTHNFVQEFIAFFGDALIEKSSARQWASYALATHTQENMQKRLDVLLKDYSSKFSLEWLRSWASTNSNGRPPPVCKQTYRILSGAAVLIRRYRSNIAQYFCENAVSTPVNPVSLSARLESLGQQLSLSERFGLLARSGANHLDPEEIALNLNTPSETTDEDEVKLFMDLEPLRDMLVSNEVFNRTASKLRQVLYHNDMQYMESIESIMTLRSELHRYSFHMDWSLAEYMLLQYGEQFPSVGAVIVITGSALYAQATTCEDYIKQTWPKTGMLVVNALNAFLNPSDASYASAYDGT